MPGDAGEVIKYWFTSFAVLQYLGRNGQILSKDFDGFFIVHTARTEEQ